MPRLMNELQKIETDIETTRNCLNEMVNRNIDRITTPEILQLSQALDQLLNLYLKTRKE
ncbi:MAG: Spo0E family sporulation regulatory protein-aspartic acid phosphatase [Bacillota bacterium]